VNLSEFSLDEVPEESVGGAKEYSTEELKSILKATSWEGVPDAVARDPSLLMTAEALLSKFQREGYKSRGREQDDHVYKMLCSIQDQYEETGSLSIKQAAVVLRQARKKLIVRDLPPSPPTKAQLDYIYSLSKKVGDVKSLSPQTKEEATKIIEELKARAAESYVDKTMLHEDGFFKDPTTGDIYMVQWNLSGSGLYAKVLKKTIDLRNFEDYTENCTAEVYTYLAEHRYDERGYAAESDYVITDSTPIDVIRWADENGRIYGTWVYRGRAPLRYLTPDNRLTPDEAREFGHLYGICCICSRRLNKEESKQAGIGPVCAAKMRKEGLWA